MAIQPMLPYKPNPLTFGAQSTISAQLALKGMEIFYDVRYALTDYNGTGNLMLLIPETLFDLFIRKDHRTDALTGSLKFTTISNANTMRVQVYPDNGYTQLTARELKQVYNFRQNMTDAFNTWNVVWQELLERALLEYPYPDMCYYCP